MWVLEIDSHGLELWLCCLIAQWLWANYLNFLSFGFFIFILDIIMPILWGCIEGSGQFPRHILRT